MASSTVASTVGRYGKLWGKGHETYSRDLRRILSVKGKGATKYLQNLVTSDLLSDPIPPRYATTSKNDKEEEENEVKFNKNVRPTCFLDQKGRILTDAILWKVPLEDGQGDEYLIDVPGDSAESLLDHLKKFKLRRTKGVDIEDRSEEMSVHSVYGTLNADGSPPGYLAVSTVLTFTFTKHQIYLRFLKRKKTKIKKHNIILLCNFIFLDKQ